MPCWSSQAPMGERALRGPRPGPRLPGSRRRRRRPPLGGGSRGQAPFLRRTMKIRSATLLVLLASAACRTTPPDAPRPSLAEASGLEEVTIVSNGLGRAPRGEGRVGWPAPSGLPPDHGGSPCLGHHGRLPFPFCEFTSPVGASAHPPTAYSSAGLASASSPASRFNVRRASMSARCDSSSTV